MAVFAVLSDKPNAKLEERIKSLYPAADYYKLSDSQWLVSADTIAFTLTEHLGVRAGEYGLVLVIAVSGSAAGWYTQTVWEWLKQKTTTP